MPSSEKIRMIDDGVPGMSIQKQCAALGVARSSYYYEPVPESALNLELMRLMDEHYLDHPYKGARRMHVWLTLDMGFSVNLKRVERLYYEVMGLQSVLPGRHTTKRNKAHRIYPYLLRNRKIELPDEVWAVDITYIPMQAGFMYLIAFIDLYSRYVVGWAVSNTMDAEWCTQAFRDTVSRAVCPMILNTDQGSQFTSELFTGTVLDNGTRLSMDGKGRATDNAFIERFWRSIKYESIYLNPPKDGRELYKQIDSYIYTYNNERRHQSLDDGFPVDFYHHYEQISA